MHRYDRCRPTSERADHQHSCVICVIASLQAVPGQAQKYRAPTLLCLPARCQTTSERADHQHSCVNCVIRVICVIAIEANPPGAVGRTYQTSFPRSRVGTVLMPLCGVLNVNPDMIPDPFLCRPVRCQTTSERGGHQRSCVSASSASLRSKQTRQPPSRAHVRNLVPTLPLGNGLDAAPRRAHRLIRQIIPGPFLRPVGPTLPSARPNGRLRQQNQRQGV
jgi:hypothetical protein